MNTHIEQNFDKNKEEENNNNKNINKTDKTDIINNHEEIIIRSNKYNTTNTIIEVKLPNPYLDTECVKYKRYIDYNVKSKFKSKYADYINSKWSFNSKRIIKHNKTSKTPSPKIDQHIYFTNISKSIKNKKF